MKAVILAGGEGARLRPLTCAMPKPMLPVMNAPLMEHTLRLLKNNGFTEIAVTLGYLGGKIKDCFGSGRALGVSLEYFSEASPLGTAGAVKNAEEFFDGDFLCVSGDIITDVNLGELTDFHKNKNALMTMALVKSALPMDYGTVSLRSDGRIERFSDSPDWSGADSAYVNGGIYAFSKEIFSHIKKNKNTDFFRDVFPSLTGGEIYALKLEGYWMDLADIGSYRRCHADIMDKKVSVFLPPQNEEGIWLEDGVLVEKGAVLRPPVYIGSGSRVKRGARIEPYSVLGRGVSVSSGAGIKRSVVLSRCRIEENAQLRGCVADEEAVFGRGCAVYEQAVMGRGSVAGENCAVKPSVKIWPGKEIPADTVQRKNLIWGSCLSDRIWTKTGICGVLGAEITPELSARLGAAAGSLFPGRIAVSDYGAPACAMLKSSLAGGILSAGARLYDFGEQPLPVSRSGVRFHSMNMGISVNVFTRGGTEYGEIRFIFPYGDPGPEFMEKLKQRFDAEDFVRGGGENIHEEEYLFEYKLFYLKNLINSTKKQSLGYKLIIGGGSPWAERLLKSAGSDLNCHVETAPCETPAEISDLIRREGADLGAVIDPSCQQLTLIDGCGRILSAEEYTLLSVLAVLMSHKNPRIYVPVSAPSGAERLAARYGGEIVRTKTSAHSLMKELTKSDEAMLSDQFIYNFDAVGAIIKLMDFMKSENLSLSELISRLPETHMVHTAVDCTECGLTPEELGELHKDASADFTDGIKLTFDGGWVLIRRDENSSALSIVSQGCDGEYARELADMCVSEIIGGKAR